MGQVLGLGRLVKKLRRLERRHEQGIERGLQKGAHFLLDESQKFVPVDRGWLRDSGQVSQEGSGLNTVMIVSYGDDRVHYSVYVHEDLEVGHAAPTQAKYLETPLRTKRREIAERVRKEVVR